MGPSLSLWLYRLRTRLTETDPPAPPPRPEGPLLWLHCPGGPGAAAMLELVRIARASRPKLGVLLTHPQGAAPLPLPSGASDRITQLALPPDGPASARALLEHWRPELGFFCSSSLPPALIAEAGQRGVPLGLFADTGPEEGLPEFALRGRLSQALLRRFDRVFLGSEQWAAHFRRLGLPPHRMELTGPLSEGPHALPCNEAERETMAAVLAGRPTWLAMQPSPAETPIALAAQAAAKRLGTQPGLLTFFVTAMYWRSLWKYRQRAYRYCLLDAGHMLANLELAAAAYGLAPRLTADFADASLGVFLGLASDDEAVLAGVAAGPPPAEPGPDETGLPPLDLQAKLLRVLQEGTVTPIGSTRRYPINVRVLCAANRDLREMVDKNEFRADLYYRINVVNLEVPPLRQRAEDILPLARHFLNLQSEFYEEPVKKLTTETEQFLLKYHWPGNVRELSNSMERAYVLSSDTVIETSTLPKEILTSAYTSARANSPLPTLDDVNSRLITEALQVTGGRKIATAKILGIDRRRLNRLIEKLNITVPNASK